MRKLRLDPESLRVESFRTSADGDGARGTVRGHDYDTYYCTAPATYNYPGCNTDNASWTKASCYAPCLEGAAAEVGANLD